jgi:hypothetical protein
MPTRWACGLEFESWNLHQRAVPTTSGSFPNLLPRHTRGVLLAATAYRVPPSGFPSVKVVGSHSCMAPGKVSLSVKVAGMCLRELRISTAVLSSKQPILGCTWFNYRKLSNLLESISSSSCEATFPSVKLSGAHAGVLLGFFGNIFTNCCSQPCRTPTGCYGTIPQSRSTVCLFG